MEVESPNAYQRLRWDINQALIESGDRERLLSLLSDLLHSSGWYEQINAMCVQKLRDTTSASIPATTATTAAAADDSSAPQNDEMDIDTQLPQDNDAADASSEQKSNKENAAATSTVATATTSKDDEKDVKKTAVVTNYNSLYNTVEGEAWMEIPADVKVEIMGEIKKVLEKLLVKES